MNTSTLHFGEGLFVHRLAHLLYSSLRWSDTMECNLVCLEVNLSLFMNLYSPLVYPELRREHFITERLHNQRKTMTNLHSELSVKCTFLGLLQQKGPGQIFI